MDVPLNRIPYLLSAVSGGSSMSELFQHFFFSCRSDELCGLGGIFPSSKDQPVRAFGLIGSFELVFLPRLPPLIVVYGASVVVFDWWMGLIKKAKQSVLTTATLVAFAADTKRRAKATAVYLSQEALRERRSTWLTRVSGD